MIRSKDQEHAVAAQFEHIVMPNSDGCFTTRLYAVEGRVGVFKRLAMDAQVAQSFKAWFDNGFIRLVEAEAVEAELIEAMQLAKQESMPLFKETA